MNKNRKIYVSSIVSILILLLLGYIGKAVIIRNNQNSMQFQKEDNFITDPIKEQPTEYPQLSDLAGGYMPIEDIIVDNYKVTDFEIKYDDEKKEIVEVFFLLTNTLDPQKSLFIDCPNPIVSSEKISIKSILTPIGVISIEGLFSPKNGKYWGVPPEIVVLKGKIVIENNGTIVYSRDHEFTFTLGE